ncbi:MAG: N-formylglutamate amidohydrolase [Rhodobiaceae bacterium]|nr:N-formylglutamate amidohydrolase [Rhodobiaceae bacterium]
MTENGVNSIHLDGVCRISRPHGDALPLIFDSPHSGTVFPPDFKPAIKREQVLSCADLYVDRLFLDAPLHGAVLLAAEFPRVYVDANRAADDVAPDTVADWSGPARPTEKAHLGKGLVWLAVKPDATPVYKTKLTAKEIQNRIEHYYKPYHDALDALVNGAHRKIGKVWHVNCHSMQPLSGVMDAEGPDIQRADIVLSDRDGTTCAPAFIHAMRDSLKAAGLEVAINQPFKGAEIIKRHGAPAEGRHSVQIEINRRLYLNLQTLEPSTHFADMKAIIDALLKDLASFVQGELERA